MQVWGLKTLQNDFLVFFGLYFLFHKASPSNGHKKPNFKVAVTSRPIMNFAQTLQVIVHQLVSINILWGPYPKEGHFGRKLGFLIF